LVLFSDADLSTPIEELAKLEAALAGGADVAVASRALKRSEIEIPQPGTRVLMGKIFNLLVQGLWLVPGVWDTQCGFKLFRGAAGRELFAALKTDGFAFDVEVLHRARRRGLRIAEVPVRWSHSAPTKVRWRHPLQMFWDLLRIRLGA
jgi:dolichyl-phosphate beta-glucosyltransferase